MTVAAELAALAVKHGLSVTELACEVAKLQCRCKHRPTTFFPCVPCRSRAYLEEHAALMDRKESSR